MGWIVFLALAIPLLAIFVWQILSGSVVHVPAGRLGLLLIKGAVPGPNGGLVLVRTAAKGL